MADHSPAAAERLAAALPAHLLEHLAAPLGVTPNQFTVTGLLLVHPNHRNR